MEDRPDYYKTRVEIDSSGEITTTTTPHKHSEDVDDAFQTVGGIVEVIGEVIKWIVKKLQAIWKTRIGRIVIVLYLAFMLIGGAVTLYQVFHEIEISKYNLERTLLDDGTYEICGMGTYEDRENVVIPSEYDGIPVTRIGNDAFDRCGIINITIPDSVTSIGDSAFENCQSLKSITIPNSVTSIGDSAFEGCKSLTNVVIPNSVTSIGDSAFDACTSLTNIVIPDSVTSIGDSVFIWCSSLTSVTLPDSMKSIPKQMFYHCTSLEKITIPNGVTSINRCAFAFCESLTSVTIPKSVNYIGELAFAHNDSAITFNYLGTKNQWEAIEKYDGWDSTYGILDWNYSTYNYTVSCSDGTISN